MSITVEPSPKAERCRFESCQGSSFRSLQRKGTVITETNATDVAEQSEDPREQTYLTLAREARSGFQAAVAAQVQHNRYNMQPSQREKIGEIIGKPVSGIYVSIEVPVTTLRSFNVRAASTREEMLEAVQNYPLRSWNDLDVVPGCIKVDLDGIQGLPEEPATDGTEVETSESVLADLNRMKRELRDWVIAERANGYFCDDGVNDALTKVGLAPLPAMKEYTLTRNLLNDLGTATLIVRAGSEEDARAKADWTSADFNWDNVTDEVFGNSQITVEDNSDNDDNNNRY